LSRTSRAVPAAHHRVHPLVAAPRDESTDDAGHDDAGGDRQDDGERMHGNGAAHDQRLQDIASRAVEQLVG
jgi:hypothetical protein